MNRERAPGDVHQFKIQNSAISCLEVTPGNENNLTPLLSSSSDFKELPASGTPNFDFNSNDI
jgi:hypothetical protein